jgi:hypothetical protein
MRDVKERRDKKRKIPLCARSEVVKIKYPRTCLIHICADIICCAFTKFWARLERHFDNIYKSLGMNKDGQTGTISWGTENLTRVFMVCLSYLLIMLCVVSFPTYEY